MSGAPDILFEGFTEAELLALPRQQLDALILTGQPVVFRAGSASILGEFRVEGNQLRIHRGFVVTVLPTGGDAYYLLETNGLYYTI